MLLEAAKRSSLAQHPGICLAPPSLTHLVPKHTTARHFRTFGMLRPLGITRRWQNHGNQQADSSDRITDRKWRGEKARIPFQKKNQKNTDSLFRIEPRSGSNIQVRISGFVKFFSKTRKETELRKSSRIPVQTE